MDKPAKLNLSFNGFAVHAYIDENGSLYFCGLDVCRILGYRNDNDAINKYCRMRTLSFNIPFIFDRKHVSQFVTSDDLCLLIFNSSSDRAEDFNAWLHEKILPLYSEYEPEHHSVSTHATKGSLYQNIYTLSRDRKSVV